MVDLDKSIRDNFERVQERIAKAARSANREPDGIRLVVVTKGHDLDTMRAAISAGATDLGENYVQEGIEKIRALKKSSHLVWHMIGHIQSRKSREVCENFDWIHSLDSLKLAHRLNCFAGELNRRFPVLLECNTSGEESKFGLTAWQEEKWSNLLPVISEIAELPNLDLKGLMTMSPLFPDPEFARPFFKRLKNLIEYISKHLKNIELHELSMGMSSDFEVAIEEGATIVRVGQAILGPRVGGD